MYDLQLRKHGVLVAKEWDYNIHDYVERKIESENLIFHTGDSICLDRGVVLKDLFYLIAKNMELWSIISSCLFLDELIEEAMSPLTQEEGDDGNDDDEILFLELAWRVQVSSDESGPLLSESTDFHGVGLDNIYAIEFTPLNELVRYPLVINEEYIIKKEHEEDSIFNTRRTFTLGILIREVILELSFMGSPDMKADAVEELRRRVEGIESGKTETIPWEDVEKELDEKGKQHIKPCKLCGEDARAPIFNKPSDICAKCFKKMKEN